MSPIKQEAAVHHGLSRIELEIAMNLRSQGLRFSMLVMDEDQPDSQTLGVYRLRLIAMDGTPMIVNASRSGNDADYVLYKPGNRSAQMYFWDAWAIQKLTPARG